jgi:diguanylate cyclase (GGDEF)-like protein/PAS domain S-box-containing protein
MEGPRQTAQSGDHALKSGWGEESPYRQIVEAADVGVWAIDARAQTTFVSSKMASMLGYESADLEGRPMLEFVDDRALAIAESRLQGGRIGTERLHLHFRCKDGSSIATMVSLNPLPAPKGESPGSVATVTDLSDQPQAEQALERSEGRLRAAVEGAPIVLWALDANGIITLSEGSGLVNLGFKPGQLVGTSVFDLYGDHAEAVAAIKRALAGEAFNTVMQTGDLWFESKYSPILDQQGAPCGTIAVSHDITERKQAEQRVAYLAYHDELTGLPNRSMFQQSSSFALARARRRGQAVALLYLDLDRFKLVNDSFGHAAGDQLLREIATRVCAVVREEDIVARHSGDEFLILLADLDAGASSEKAGPSASGSVRAAEMVAAKIHETLREPLTIDGESLSIDASIGISLYPRDAPDQERLLQHADTAMYESKRTGRGGTEVYGRSHRDSTAQLSIAGRLRGALERDEFELHYQPIVALSDGKMQSVEALLRWRHPDGRLLPPGDFLAVAEEVGMIVAIDDWVLREAARQWRVWSDAGTQLRMSVNISTLQFRRYDLADVLLKGIAESGGDPRWIVVEITESAMMADVERTKRILDQLCNASVRVALDDFGSGYSSLGRLSDLVVHTLKLDRTFVRNVPRDELAAVMVAGVVEIARRMHVYSLAEGIETAEQRDFLIKCGCDLGQGYFFGRPAPPAELQARFAHYL